MSITDEQRIKLVLDWANRYSAQTPDTSAHEALKRILESEAAALERLKEVGNQAVGFHVWLSDIAQVLSGTRLRTLNDLPADVAKMKVERDAALERVRELELQPAAATRSWGRLLDELASAQAELERYRSGIVDDWHNRFEELRNELESAQAVIDAAHRLAEAWATEYIERLAELRAVLADHRANFPSTERN